MVVPIAISANGCVPLGTIAIVIGDQWIHYNGTNGTTRWKYLFTITTQSEWIIWNNNGDNGSHGDNDPNGDNGTDNGDIGANGNIGTNGTNAMATTVWRQWR